MIRFGKAFIYLYYLNALLHFQGDTTTPLRRRGTLWERQHDVDLEIYSSLSLNIALLSVVI